MHPDEHAVKLSAQRGGVLQDARAKHPGLYLPASLLPSLRSLSLPRSLSRVTTAVAVIAVAVITVAVIAVVVSGRRLYLLDNKQVAGYGDGVGPYVLCGAVFFVFFAELWAN